ncbi:MAG TPA: aminotransferase class V-fold PLP-dependent enzyme, partial [Bacteroidales bacterium]|nr:aminotransferase class V-fold PLP-dependent enzyme [Bacteroidales bacterium]
RAGTENVAGIAGMAKALDLVTCNMDTAFNKITELRSFLIEELPKEIPGLKFLGDATGNSLYTIINFALPGRMESGQIMSLLDLSGICASAGSACSSGSNKPSPVLLAMGVDPLTPNLRISFNMFNTIEEGKKLIVALKKIPFCG